MSGQVVTLPEPPEPESGRPIGPRHGETHEAGGSDPVSIPLGGVPVQDVQFGDYISLTDGVLDVAGAGQTPFIVQTLTAARKQFNTRTALAEDRYLPRAQVLSELPTGYMRSEAGTGVITTFTKIPATDVDGLPEGGEGTVGPQGPAGPVGPVGPQGPEGVTGEEGPQGPQGLQGPQGPQGEPGVAGVDGNDGATGPAGPQGAKGDTGLEGSQGVPGEPGPMGMPGAEGAQGPAGSQGTQGPVGPQGEVGSAGAVGPVGPTGSQGVGIDLQGSVPTFGDLPEGGSSGDAWFTDDTGHIWVWDEENQTWFDAGNFPQGPQGIEGPQGPVGPQGEPGPVGPEGPRGLQGTQGPAGMQGDTGAQGPQGAVGQTGPQGSAGADGAVGPQGAKGDTGTTGAQGLQGPTGPEGPQGPKGDTGAQGIQGIQGVEGPAGTNSGMTTLRKTANQTINAGVGVFTDVTGLTFPVVSGQTYAFYFYVVFQSAQVNTGHKCSVNAPAGTLDFHVLNQIIANAAAGAATWTERHNTVRDDMTLLTSTIAAAADLICIVQGRYVCTANGTFAVRFANELAANTDLVVQAGSWGFYF